MSKKILIIDDEPDVMLMLVYRLKAQGLEVITAASAQAGIDLAIRECPDLILLDYRLPDMRAEDVAQRIRSFKKLSQVKIILITASTSEIEKKARDCQCIDSISKPIDADILLDKIAKYL